MFVVLALLGGTFYASRWLNAPPIEHAPVAVLVADFENTTSDPALGTTVGQALRRGLESASFITAFDRTRLRGTFGVAAPDRFDEVAARQLAIKQGLGVVVAGLVAPHGSGYEVTVKASEPMTGNVITSTRGELRTRANCWTRSRGWSPASGGLLEMICRFQRSNSQ